MIILCSYSGVKVHNEKELTKLFYQFLTNNPNPFCIGINQVFHILRKDHFKCTVGHDNLNYIRIEHKVKDFRKDEDNIIQFRK